MRVFGRFCKRGEGEKSLLWPALFLFVLAGFLFSGPEAVSKTGGQSLSSSFVLTEKEEEQLALLEGRRLRIGYVYDAEYCGKEGMEAGFLAPFGDFLREELSLEADYVPYAEQALLPALKSGAVDFAYVDQDALPEGVAHSAGIYEDRLYFLSTEEKEGPSAGQVLGYLGSGREAETVKRSLVPGCHGSPYGSLAALSRDVENGVLDGMVLGRAAALEAAKDPLLYPRPLSQGGQMCLATGKSRDKAVIEMLDRYLLETEEGALFCGRMQVEEETVLRFVLQELENDSIMTLKKEGPGFSFYDTLAAFRKTEEPGMTAYAKRVLQFVEGAGGFSIAVLEAPPEAPCLTLTADAYLEEEGEYCLSRKLGEERLLAFCGEEGGDARYFGVLQDTVSYFDKAPALQRQIRTEADEGLLLGERIAYGQTGELLKALTEGKIDKAVLREEVFQTLYFSGEYGRLRLLGGVGTVPVYFAVPEGREPLAAVLDQAIRLSAFYVPSAVREPDFGQAYLEQLETERARGFAKTVCLWIGIGVLALAAAVLGWLGWRGGNIFQKREKRPPEPEAQEAVEQKTQPSSKAALYETEEACGIDALTGLYGKKLYEEKLCGIVEQDPEALGVFALVDVDRLKKINAHYGREAGDALLVELAKSLRCLTEGGSQLAFRLGSDDFGVFSGGLADHGQVQQFCQKLRNLSLSVEFEGERIIANFSIGVAVFNKDAFSLLDLTECAKKAMAICKENGLKMSFYR